MVTSRTVLAGSCLALAMLSGAACVQVNEVISGRDLECVEVPEDICVRLADHIVGFWRDPQMIASDGPIVKVTVKPTDCGGVERPNPAMVRCWDVRGGAAEKADGVPGRPDGVHWYYYQNVDGSLFDGDGGVIDK